MTPKFKVGDKVQINYPKDPTHGHIGEIVKIRNDLAWMHQVKLFNYETENNNSTFPFDSDELINLTALEFLKELGD